MEIVLKPKQVTIFCSAIVALLIAAHIYHLYVFYWYHHYLSLIDLNYEGNIPTLYSALSILFCAVLLLIISGKKLKQDEKFGYRWLILGLIFFFLAYDEYFAFHDHLTPIFRRFIKMEGFKIRGIFHFAWIIPYGILTLIFGVAYISFLKGLPKKYRNYFVISGAIYVTGASVLEMIGAPRKRFYGRTDHLYAMWTTLEESFEMIGILFFIYTLMSYIAEIYNNLGFKIKRFAFKISKD